MASAKAFAFLTHPRRTALRGKSPSTAKACTACSPPYHVRTWGLNTTEHVPSVLVSQHLVYTKWTSTRGKRSCERGCGDVHYLPLSTFFVRLSLLSASGNSWFTGAFLYVCNLRSKGITRRCTRSHNRTDRPSSRLGCNRPLPQWPYELSQDTRKSSKARANISGRRVFESIDTTKSCHMQGFPSYDELP